MKKDKATLEYFKEIKEKTKVSFEVGSVPNDNMFLRGVYRTGDGDYIQPLRPGSQDHKKWKSKGLLASSSS
jgi:hypothetical protein